MALGGGSDVVTIFIARLADPAAGTRRLHFRVVIANPDCGREDTDSDAFFILCHRCKLAARTHGSFYTIAAIGPLIAVREGGPFILLALIIFRTFIPFRSIVALGAVVALRPLVAIVTSRPIRALRAIAARFAVLTTAVAARRGTLAVAFIFLVRLTLGAGGPFVAITIFIITRAALILFFEARAAILEDAEIVIGELKIIFGLNTIPRELHVARQCLIFLEQLGGIAALAIVLTIAVRTT